MVKSRCFEWKGLIGWQGRRSTPRRRNRQSIVLSEARSQDPAHFFRRVHRAEIVSRAANFRICRADASLTFLSTSPRPPVELHSSALIQPPSSQMPGPSSRSLTCASE